ncbi:non-ribosomal peptide synthetase [Pseudonocardia endophytica]|uniref:Mycobactin peptide synthetase MbtF n=1 Tax=Pseudonocardia endophytica TaxID=401976 RepID=A0A4R1HX22_PSEEN|nr:non-ribosomal peptide synthetase [Pseudonocardia endophytica]TCK24589.1 mycobactin peptide synthetase MbtF [Pseudonocardia endophytica]
MTGIADVLALTPLQRGMHALHLVSAEAGESEIYTVELVLDLDGTLDVARLRRAVTTVLRRHPNLAATFRSEGLPHPVALVPAEPDVPWREVDATPDEFAALLEHELRTAFALESAPACRAVLGRLGPDRHRLVWTFHHIVVDGWSIPLLWDDLAAAYRADDPSSLPEPAPYRDYIAWLQGQDTDAARDHWRAVLSDVDGPTKVGIPTAGDAGHPSLTMRYLDGEPLAALHRDAAALGVTINTLAQVAWAILLHRITGRTDVTFGGSVSGRPEQVPRIGEMVGLFTNTVPTRVRLVAGEPVGELCHRVQREGALARTHGYLQLGELQRQAGRGELFDTILSYHNVPKDASGGARELGDGLVMRPVFMDGYTHYPLVVAPFELDGRLYVNVDTRAGALPDGVDPGELGETFLRTVTEIAAAPSREFRAIGRRHEAPVPDTGRAVPPAGIHEVFAAVAARQPDDVAATDALGSLTYGELDAWARRISADLAAAGVRREGRVAVAMDRTAGYLAAVFGVLGAGGVVVPLDVTAPAERNALILDHASAAVLLTSPGIEPAAGPAVTRMTVPPRPDPSEPVRFEPLPALPGQGAYVVFTSGSTGVPKGVVATHDGVLALLRNHVEAIYRPAGGDDRRLRVAHGWSFAFDAAWQPQLALLAGHELVLLDEDDRREPDRLIRVLRRHGVDMLDTSPSLLRPLRAAGLLDHGGLSVLALGSEDIAADVWRDLADRPELQAHNFYGPTETTVEVFSARIAPGSSPSVGLPARGTTGHVLGPDLTPVPAGFVGELYLAGPQVTRGYDGQPARTAARYLPDVAGGGGRMYRTGDLVRRDAAGSLVFVGRADDQVKIRGYRVETGEVVAALRAHPGVRDAVVTTRARGASTVLVAYLVAAHDGLDTADVRASATTRLPGYMVPARVVAVPAIPTDVNGKTDFRALAAFDADSAADVAGPRTPTERRVHDVVAQALDVPAVDVVADLADAGIDSITVIGIVAGLRHEGIAVSARTVLSAGSIAELALHADRAPEPDDVPEAAAGPVRMPALDWLGVLGAVRRYAMTLVVALPSDARPDRVETVLRAVVAAHPQLAGTLVRDGDRLTLDVPADPDPSVPVARYDVHAPVARAVARLAGQAWDRLDPDEGRMLAATHVRGAGLARPLLVLALHHVVCDVVSWHVLLADMAAAWRSVEWDEPVRLPGETTPLAAWSRALDVRAGSAEVAAQRPYWTGVADRVDRAPRLGSTASATYRDMRVHRQRSPVPDSGSCTVEVLVLAALGAAWATALSAAGGPPGHGPPVALEGHGRVDELVERDAGTPIDTSRTLGWFTTTFPTVVGGPDATAPTVDELRLPGAAEAWLGTVADALAAVPAGGADAGLLGHVPVPGGYGVPEVLVTYLGRVDRISSARAVDARPWTAVTDPGVVGEVPIVTEPDMSCPFALELSVGVQAAPEGSVLESYWRHVPARLAADVVSRLAGAFDEALVALSGGTAAAVTAAGGERSSA